MFSFLFLLAGICFLADFWPIAVMFFVIFFAILIISAFQKQSSDVSDAFEVSVFPDNKRSTPRIGATVSHPLYDEIRSFCQNHHMTMSDLIRKSVKKYMNESAEPKTAESNQFEVSKEIDRYKKMYCTGMISREKFSAIVKALKA